MALRLTVSKALEKSTAITTNGSVDTRSVIVGSRASILVEHVLLLSLSRSVHRLDAARSEAKSSMDSSALLVMDSVQREDDESDQR